MNTATQALTLHRLLRNQTQWVSIAEFLKVDPLVKLGLPGGWAAGASGARQGAADCGPESIIPLGNHGDNNFRTSEVVR